MNNEANISSSIERLKTITKDLIRKRTVELGLIDTGLMYKSYTVDVVIKPDLDITIEINSTDYFKYVEANYGLIDWVIEQTSFSEAYTDLFAEVITNEIL